MNEQERYLRFPGSKWTKHQVLTQDERIRKHLPHTGRWSLSQVERWLNAYPVLYLKPVLGGGGRGVIRIVRNGQGYVISKGTGKKLCYQRRHLLQTLKNYRLRRYLIQKGIDLIRIQGRPVDFRVLLLKEDQSWSYIGIMGKVAAKNRHVTNHSRGGHSIRFTEALKRGCGASDEQVKDLEQRLERFGLRVARKLNEHFVNLTELGLDVAIDNERRHWLLEANSKPQYELFRDHEDKSLFEKIDKFMKKDRES